MHFACGLDVYSIPPGRWRGLCCIAYGILALQYGQDHCKVGGPRDGIIPES